MPDPDPGSEAPASRSWLRGRGACYLAIFLIALGVRVANLYQIHSAPFFPCRLGDAETYHEWASEIASGDWVGEDVFYQAPLYPYFLASIYVVFGDGVLTVRICQIIIGALSCVFLAAAGWNLFGRGAGVVAGVMLAFHPAAIFFDTMLQKSILDLVFLTVALWLIGRLLCGGGRGLWVALGAVLGGLVLTRENALALVPALLIWIAFVRGGVRPVVVRRDRVVAGGLLILGVGLTLLPVALRNQFVGGEFHLTTSQLGPNFYIGNNPIATGVYAPLRSGHGHARHERTDAFEIAERALGRSLTAGEVSRFYLEKSYDYIREEPGAWLALLGRKLALTFNFIEITDSEDPYTHSRWSHLLRVGNAIGHFGVLAPLALLGLWITWPERRRVWVLYLLGGSFVISVILFFVFARYRFPLVPFAILFAAAGLVRLPFWLRSRSRREMIMPAAVVVGFAVFCAWPIYDRAEMRIGTLINVGTCLAARQELRAAAEQFEEVLELTPGSAVAHNNLGAVLEEEGKVDEAVEHYRQALLIRPAYPSARRNLERATGLSPGSP